MKNLSLGWLVMATALTIGMTACSSADSIAEEPVQQPENPAKKTYTMTVTASKGGDNALARAMAEAGLTGDATTRALTLGTDSETGKPTLSATWKAGETVKVYCNDEEIGTLTAQSDGAETTLSGTLDEAPTAGQDITLCFPKAPCVYTGQKGTLADIAQNFDYAAATIAADAWKPGDKITTTGTVNFTNQQAIVKFTLVDKADGKTALDASSLTLHADGGWMIQTYNFDLWNSTMGDITITPEEPTSEIWVSMIAIYLTNFTLTATVGTDTYIYERKSDVTFTSGQFYSITVKMESTTLKGNADLSTVKRDMTVADGATLSGTLGGNYKLTIADGATVTLNGAIINGTNSGESYKWAGLTCAGDATIVLADGSENTVKGFHRYYPGIHVAPGHTLTIQGTGALTATSNGMGAGIGGGSRIDCGNIVIAGGNITANGQSNAAGIGSGAFGSCGAITISGTASVTATSNGMGAGIGSGQKASCGTITITGGTVSATGGKLAAGIGSGAFGSCGAITISGTASVTATGHAYGAGIGSGENASCGTITISGGTVSATGGLLAPGIGSGNSNDGSASCDGVIITTGVTSVTATKGADDSGLSTPYSIGNGRNSSCGTVTIGCTLDGSGNPVGGTVGMVSTSPYTYTPGI